MPRCRVFPSRKIASRVEPQPVGVDVLDARNASEVLRQVVTARKELHGTRLPGEVDLSGPGQTTQPQTQPDVCKHTNPSVRKRSLEALERIASPAQKDRRGQILALLSQDQPKGVEDPREFAAWKRHEARATVRIFGPEGAIGLFREIDPARPGDRTGIAGGAVALAEYAMNEFPLMTAKESDGERDALLKYGISLLSGEP